MAATALLKCTFSDITQSLLPEVLHILKRNVGSPMLVSKVWHIRKSSWDIIILIWCRITCQTNYTNPWKYWNQNWTEWLRHGPLLAYNLANFYGNQSNGVCSPHRPLKLRTDGGQSRVRELGSIDLFVVTCLKMNQLSPNFKHKFPIMCAILAANFFAIRSAFPVLLWPPIIRLVDVHCEMRLVFRPFSPCPISEVSWPIVTKLCYMFDGKCSL